MTRTNERTSDRRTRGVLSWSKGLIARAAVASVLLSAGCYGNEMTSFPSGLEPWETPNMAMPPAAQGSDMFPERLSFLRGQFMHPVAMRRVNSVHARAFIQQPITAVWAAARDPQTGRDPTQSNGFAVLAYATDPMYQFSFRTHVLVNSIAGNLEWDVEWRHGVVEGTADAPTVTATRWQKTSGSTAINVLEGSLVLRTVSGQPNVTEVQYQYHLNAAFSDHGTIETYLGVIFSRLRDRAHGRTLDPNDCTDCPTPPAGY